MTSMTRLGLTRQAGINSTKTNEGQQVIGVAHQSHIREETGWSDGHNKQQVFRAGLCLGLAMN